jgi:hypothetical protein
MSDLPKGSEEANKYPDLTLAQTIYEYEQGRKVGGNAEETHKQSILKSCFASNMTPFYESCCDKYGWAKDNSKLGSMK